MEIRSRWMTAVRVPSLPIPNVNENRVGWPKQLSNFRIVVHRRKRANT